MITCSKEELESVISEAQNHDWKNRKNCEICQFVDGIDEDIGDSLAYLVEGDLANGMVLLFLGIKIGRLQATRELTRNLPSEDDIPGTGEDEEGSPI